MGKDKDRAERALVAFDVDRIQEFVFATHRPLDAMGASELVKDLTEEGRSSILPDLLRELDCAARVIYAQGGSGLIEVEDPGQGEILAQRLEEAFRQHTLSGSCTAVSLQIDKADLQRRERFQQALRWLALGLRRRKAERAAEECSEAWAMGYLPRCRACGIYPAMYESEIGGEKEWICEACKRKRERGREARRQERMAESFEDIVSRPAEPNLDTSADLEQERRYLAVIYADVNKAGDLLQRCSTLKEVRALSRHLWDALQEGVRFIRERFPERYQSPIVGGDDLLLFIPATGCIESLRQVWDKVESELQTPPLALKGKELEEELQRLTLSFGLLVAPHHLPAPFLFELVQLLVQGAKRFSYQEGRSALDFLLLKGGTPLSESLEELRETFLKHSYPLPKHFPGERGLESAVAFHLTGKPYTKDDFWQLSEGAQKLKAYQGGLQHLGAIIESAKENPMEAWFNTAYQVARHQELRRVLATLPGGSPGDEARFFFQIRTDEQGQEFVITQLLDLLELMEMDSL